MWILGDVVQIDSLDVSDSHVLKVRNVLEPFVEFLEVIHFNSCFTHQLYFLEKFSSQAELVYWPGWDFIEFVKSF